jgi:hypothetical protein
LSKYKVVSSEIFNFLDQLITSKIRSLTQLSLKFFSFNSVGDSLSILQKSGGTNRYLSNKLTQFYYIIEKKTIYLIKNQKSQKLFKTFLKFFFGFVINLHSHSSFNLINIFGALFSFHAQKSKVHH